MLHGRGSSVPLVACRDCAAIQRLRPLATGRQECWQCGRVLENRAGRSIDRALACSLTVLLLLFPANLLPLMTVHLGPVTGSTLLASGLVVAWSQGWPLVSIVLALEAIILPFVRFGLLSITLAALRCGRRDRWLGAAFRYCEVLDLWAMADVLLIGAGIGYGRVASQVQVTIDAGGWCFVSVAVMTMVTRASLERRDVWRCLGADSVTSPPHAVSCTGCDLLLPAHTVGRRCPRCLAVVRRRRPFAVSQCTALVIATAALTPIAYGYPMSEFWKGNQPSANSVLDGLLRLFQSGYWYFGVLIFFVSIVFPLTKIAALAWFVASIRRHSSWRLRLKTRLYRFIDETGRWSTLDPFTVLVFAPMIQFGQLAHFDFMGGAAAFLATVVLSMIAARQFDPRLLWDSAGTAVPAVSAGALHPTLVPSGSPRR